MMEMALRQQERRSKDINARASLRGVGNEYQYECHLQEAKAGAQKAANQVLSNLVKSMPPPSGRRGRGPNSIHEYNHDSLPPPTSTAAHLTHPVASSSDSIVSTEVAVERGLLRALSERNDEQPWRTGEYLEMTDPPTQTNGLQTGGDFDLDTINEPYSQIQTDSAPPNKKRGFLKKMAAKVSAKALRKQKNTPPGMTVLVSGISKEAWMCGCCGKVFSTFRAADDHETKCIQEVINLGGFGGGLGRRSSSDPSDLPHEQYNTNGVLRPALPNSATRREAFVSERQQPPTPTGLSRNPGVEDNLMDDLDLRDISHSNRSAKSLYSSARSVQPGMPSPWDSKSHLSMDVRHPNVSTHPSSQPTTLDLPGLNKASVSFQDQAVSLQCPPPLSTMMVDYQAPTPRRKLDSSFDRATNEPATILLTRSMKEHVIITDEALVNSVTRAAEIVLTSAELDAEKELECLANDKRYYEDMTRRAYALKANPITKFRTDGKSVASKIQNKFVDAWQLIKEGDKENRNFNDEYVKKTRDGSVGQKELVHNGNTHYINVFVKHSIRVVNSELERLAEQRWEDQGESRRDDGTRNFEQFRKFAHVNLVRLAKLALAADFTPRKVSVQLSNDLYRLMAPQLKRRGVAIETEIEYRVGPYFVLAVNIISIDWTKLIKYSHRLVTKQKKEWIADQGRREELREEHLTEERKGKHKQHSPHPNAFMSVVNLPFRLYQLTRFEILAQFLSWMYYVHWTISIPVCWILFQFFIQSTMNKYILTTVADEIFSYVEEKGMEMEIQIMAPNKQAAFMLSALRELREGTKAQKNKKKDKDGEGKDHIIGPLMGPAIKSDKGPAPEPPPGFEMPDHLEFINLEIDLQVGFKRLRWAMLSSKSTFSKDALFGEANCENVVIKEWSRHNDIIGSPDLPDGVSEDDILGAEREAEYLMPKSTFVKANTVFDTSQITAYNDYCLCIKKRTLSPEVPYGTTFVTWTQMLIVNTGNDTCHLTTSVEAEFPNGPPIISRQIVGGMRSGTAESFVRMTEIIAKYAGEFP